jgi:lysophospholipase L1-like esterase
VKTMSARLATPILIAGLILGIELVLEVRHVLKGYDTLLLGPLLRAARSTLLESATPAPIMVDGTYVFRSLPLRAERVHGVVRIWIASASHAEHSSLPLSDIFPSRICQELQLRNMKCETLNASKAGFSIDDNVRWLREKGGKYRPDYAVLYQQSSEINRAQRDFLGEKTFRDQSQPLLPLGALRTKLQSSSTYPLVYQYLGGTSLLSGFMMDALPPAATQRYLALVRTFITASREQGIEPIVTTFAASHRLENLNTMAYSDRLAFVRWEHQLSPVGWVRTISAWNAAVRALAREENAPLVDLEESLNGHPELFVDFVHFNLRGHQLVAKNIAAAIAELHRRK